MSTIALTIVNKRGLHARASAAFVQCAEKFSAQITVKRGDAEVSALSLMGLMLLGAYTGTVIEVTAEGDDAPAALLALRVLVEAGFYED